MYENHNEIDKQIKIIEDEISQLSEGESVSAEVFNGEFLKIGNIYSHFDKEATINLKPGNTVSATVNKINKEDFDIESRITRLIK